MRNIKLKVTKPENVQFTLNVTMSLGEWNSLCSSLGSDLKSPAYEFRQGIREAIQKAEKEFSPDIPKE